MLDKQAFIEGLQDDIMRGVEGEIAERSPDGT